MTAKNFHEVIRLIRKDDPRYEIGAYFFIRQALDHTLSTIRRKEEGGRQRHVTGGELCEGIREYALDQYGPMTRTLLENWGIHSTADFGQIVFNLVEYGVFGKTETDSLEDFDEVYDFESAFSRPFQPSPVYQQEASQHVGRHPD
ncbi:MAG: hypothetical protein R6V45_11430 [Oceanipulchritudo sp.]